MTGELLPLNETETVVLATAARLKLPGMDGGLIDARPSTKRLLAELYRNGYILLALKGDQASDAAAKLNQNQRAPV